MREEWHSPAPDALMRVKDRQLRPQTATASKTSSRTVLRALRVVIVSLGSTVSNAGTSGDQRRRAQSVARRDDTEITLVTNVRSGSGLYSSDARARSCFRSDQCRLPAIDRRQAGDSKVGAGGL